MPLDALALRMTMRQWVTGVTVVTTVAGDERAGMTVSSFTSVSLEPPTVLVCLNNDTYAQMLVKKSGVFAISMLSSEQAALSNRFAGVDPTITDRFAGLDFITADTGSPLLAGALGWLDCVVRDAVVSGTHTIYIGEVVFAQVQADLAPLVYYDRAYQTLHAIEPTQS